MQMGALSSVSCPLFLPVHILLLQILFLCLGSVSLSSTLDHAAASMLIGSYNAVHVVYDTDRLALLAFKDEITADPLGVLNLWNESLHFCRWYGVTCGRRHRQRVVGLNLDNQLLTGPISPHLGNLSFLRELWLQNNSLSHIIPPQLCRLRRLRSLSLRNNSLTGEIPANISACSNLAFLAFTGNRLQGKIPMELGSLSKLEEFFVEWNNLTGGIPSTFGNLSSLRQINAHTNRIGGNIPYALGQLTNLDFFEVGDNKFVGTIPPSIFNLSKLAIFAAPLNQIQGELPSDLGTTLPNIKFLDVSHNLFTGSIPISITNAAKLSKLYLLANDFTGKVPLFGKLQQLEVIAFHGNHLGTGGSDDSSFFYSLTNTTKLRFLDLGSNNFGGVFPKSINNFSANLRGLSLADNNIVGSIPTGIGNLLNLYVIQISNNHFTGEILPDIGNLLYLAALALDGNEFSGNIPSTFGNLTALTRLYLSSNNLHGDVPSSLGKCQMLNDLRLDQNNLSGSIPVEIFDVSSLRVLNLSSNSLTGSLPSQVGNLRNLEMLDVSENFLFGTIPSTLGSCVQLRWLYMEGNKCRGTLPSSLRDLRSLETLDISRNNFSGTIPDYLEGFIFLRWLNLAFNDFEGAVPERGVFTNSSIIAVEGNSKLCGGIPELQLQSCKFRKKRFTPTLRILIPASFGLLGGIILILFFLRYMCRFRKSKKLPLSSLLLSSFLGSSTLRLSYQSVLKATNGFSQANLLGVGSFGSVYKGILDQDAKVVAVKVLNLQFRGASKSFIAECEALRRIRHRNLVKVLTACSSVDYQGNNFKAIVYEFMANGSLDEWLHPIDENEDGIHEESRKLNLLQRLNISIDVAFALDYLHNHCTKPIVHCDLKPSNILLDKDIVGHVGDFGLARFLHANQSSSSANQSSSIGIRGTVGYAAPEYGTGNEVSTSGDLYSYGILLLEMFTGKRPTDNMFTDSLSLHQFAKTALQEQVVMSIADPTLFEQREDGEADSSINNAQNSAGISEIVRDCLISILNVGITCSEDVPRDRQAIMDVIPQLHGIKNTLIGIGQVHGDRRARIKQ